MFSAYFLIWIFRLLNATTHLRNTHLLALEEDRPRL